MNSRGKFNNLIITLSILLNIVLTILLIVLLGNGSDKSDKDKTADITQDNYAVINGNDAFSHGGMTPSIDGGIYDKEHYVLGTEPYGVILGGEEVPQDAALPQTTASNAAAAISTVTTTSTTATTAATTVPLAIPTSPQEDYGEWLDIWNVG